MKIGMLAGEASGDLLGAKLIHALRKRCSDLKIEGIGGTSMIVAGCNSLYDMERLSVMGFIDPLLRLPELIQMRRKLFEHFAKNPPDVFIGIDAPDFNLGLEAKFKQLGIPVVHYVSPSVWAWRSYRIKKIAKAVDLMLTLLPFEAKFYEQHHIPVRYVGHPLADQIPLYPDQIAARRALCIDEHATYVALLPGSRKQEIRYMAEPFLLGANQALQHKSDLKFITTHVNSERYQEFYDAYKHYAPNLPIEFFTRRTQDVIAAADVVIVTSGTATLETMLYKKPMVIAYKMPKLIYPLIRRMVKAPYAGLPNLLANQQIVPELIQNKLTPDTLCHYILDYLDHPEKVTFLQNRFVELHKQLCFDSSERAIDAIFELLNHQPQQQISNSKMAKA